VVLGVLILLAGALILLGMAAKSSLGRYLWTILLARTVLGLAANLLVVFSTNVYPLMMGSFPLDLLFVGIILLDGKEKQPKKLVLPQPGLPG